MYYFYVEEFLSLTPLFILSDDNFINPMKVQLEKRPLPGAFSVGVIDVKFGIDILAHCASQTNDDFSPTNLGTLRISSFALREIGAKRFKRLRFLPDGLFFQMYGTGSGAKCIVFTMKI